MTSGEGLLDLVRTDGSMTCEVAEIKGTFVRGASISEVVVAGVLVELDRPDTED